MSTMEHTATKHFCDLLERYFDVEVVRIDPRIDGLISPADVLSAVNSDTNMVIVIHASNESGIINDVDNIARKVKYHFP